MVARSWLIRAFSGLSLLVLSATSVLAQVTVFPQCNFLGTPVTLSAGDYDTRALARAGVRDDDISSIVVSEGYGIKLFTDDRFRGRSATLTGIMQCLDDTMNEAVSSLRVGTAAQLEAMDGFSSSAPQASSDGVTVYTECGYRGRSATLAAGEYSVANLREQGLPDNSISSIQVPKGMSITLFVNDFQRGQSGKLQSNNDCLVDRYNDRVSSVLVAGTAESAKQVPQKGSPVQVYSGCDFRGNGARLPPGDYTASDLAALGLSDNSIASIRAPEGMELHIFVNDFQRGRSAVVTGDERCLTGTRFDGQISSLKVIHSEEAQRPVAKPQVAVFSQCNYSGESASLDIGEYNAGALYMRGLADNSISSIRIPKGVRVTAFEHDFFRGGNIELDKSIRCLSERSADNAISSLIIEGEGASDNPADAAPQMSRAERQRLSAGLTCVGEFVESNLCIADAWSLMSRNCGLAEIPLLSDGYFESHVKAGNCVSSKWQELARRVVNPEAR